MSSDQRRLAVRRSVAGLFDRLGLQRPNQILAGVLVLQLVVAAFVFWPRGATIAGAAPAFSDLKAEDVVALRISEAGDNEIALRKVSGEWVLPDAANYPVQSTKVSPVLDKLVGLSTKRLVTRTDDSHRRLQVASDDYVRRLEIETAAGDIHALFLGSSPAYGATHFRVEGRDETYITDGLSTWELNTAQNSWIDTTYVDVPLDQVTSFALTNPQGSLTLTQDAEGTWSLEGLEEGETLDQNLATSLVRRVASLRMDRPLGTEQLPAYGLSDPAATATLTTKDGTMVVRVGAQDAEDSSFVVSSSSSDYVVRAPAYAIQDLVEKGRQDLLVVPTPEAGAAATP